MPRKADRRRIWPLALLLTAVVIAPARADEPTALRFAAFTLDGVETRDLRDPSNDRVRDIAEVLQRLRPNVTLVVGVPYDIEGSPGHRAGEPEGRNADRFVRNFLARSQAEGLAPLSYNVFTAPTNSGMPSGFDLDRSGEVVTDFDPRADDNELAAFIGDAWGYGEFPGQRGMVLLVDTRLEIAEDRVRTFRLFPWSYMPSSMMPSPENSDGSWYDDELFDLVRLSSAGHWDVPVRLPSGTEVRVLASAPGPVGGIGVVPHAHARAHDEARFWADYVENASYLVDDRASPGGLPRGTHFVILGPLRPEGAREDALSDILLRSRVIAPDPRPARGGQDDGPSPTTASGARVDFILHSRSINTIRAGVWTTEPAEPRSGGFPSSHYPVWADLAVPSGPGRP